jgi:uncharacterized protein YkwD
MNRVRQQAGLQPLALDLRLTRTARHHSEWMLKSGQFTHSDFTRRVRHCGVPASVFGENLAWGTLNNTQADAIVADWMASPEHRDVMLRPGFSRIGVGEARGTFAGTGGAILITADFAGS